jgi:hypothetical protein
MGLQNEFSVDTALDNLSLTKDELKTSLIKAMCECAREISHNKPKYMMYNIKFNGDPIPKVFNPGTSEKMLFQFIVDWNLNEIYEKRRFAPQEIKGIAARLMVKHYFPMYDQYRESEN